MELTETATGFVAPPLLTVKEAAHLARVSRSYMWKLLDRGEVEAVRIGNTKGPLRIPTESFLALLYGDPPAEGTSPGTTRRVRGVPLGDKDVSGPAKGGESHSC